MENPYEHMTIYYFEGIPTLDRELETDPDFLGNWVEQDTAFLFFKTQKPDLISKVCQENPLVPLADTYRMTCEQWHGQTIDPYYVDSLCVVPPWNRMDPQENKDIKEVILDPGVVFGTGRHQTTEDCLSLIHRLCTQKKIDSVLDIGTGTGLLALGAAALGCRRVLACDFNLLAVKTCLNNIRLNRFQDRVLAFQARGEDVMDLPCDLLVANIHYDVMRLLIQAPGFLKADYFILSGLLISQARKVMDELKQMPVHIMERRCPDGVWNTILGKRLDPGAV